MPPIRLLLAAAALLALGACADIGGIGPRARLSDAVQPDSGRIEWPRRQWWQDWRDPQLARLMASAQAGNPGLRVSLARVRRAEALAGLAGERSGPQFAASLSTERELYSAKASAPPALAGQYAWRNQALLSGSYDLDLWGRQRQELAATLDEVRLAAAESQMAHLALEVALVKSYIAFALAFDLQDLAAAALARRERIVELALRRQRAGLAGAPEVARAEAELAPLRRELERQAEAQALLRDTLAALCGQGPEHGAALTRPQLRLGGAPALPDALPAELVGRRPDIAAQRWRVEAAAQRIGAARAEFYPNIDLLAFAGFQALGFASFLTPGAAVRGIAPALSLPLFAGARLRARLGERSALYDGAVEQYNATVVAALAEVAGAVSRVQSLRREGVQAEAALATAQRALALAGQSRRAGISDARGVLDGELAVLHEKQELARLGALRQDGWADLMAALGGGI